MIDKREVLAIAQQTSLTSHIVEKDYVLDWTLVASMAARASHRARLLILTYTTPQRIGGQDFLRAV